MSDETKIPENEKAPEAEKKEKKKSKKDVEIEELKAELNLKSDQLMRTAAEFDNFKKRTEREKASVAEFAKAGLIKQLLPIIDNIDRASAADRESADYIKGIEMIVKQFESVVSNLNIEELERHLRINSYSDDEIKARRIIERVKQLTIDLELISENKRK